MIKKVTPWKEISRKPEWQKYGRKIEKVTYRMPNGEKNDFYLKKEGPAVGILALTKDKKVILTKQFRPGPNKILLELPGGYIDKKETPEEAGNRELLEETGYQGKAKLVTTAFDCAYSTMCRSCVVITDCTLVSKQNLDENEFIEVVLLTIDEFKDLLRSGQNTDIEVGYLGLDYLKLL